MKFCSAIVVLIAVSVAHAGERPLLKAGYLPISTRVGDEAISGSVTRKAQSAPGVWSLTLDAHEGRSFGGVQIGLSPPLAPYLADAPERLLRDK